MPMPVKLTTTPIEGLLIVETGIFRDARGFFSESWSEPVWRAAGLGQTFRQDNLSCSKKGTLRGLHYQIQPDAMGKLVRAVRGRVFDVAVDLRRGSPSYGRWYGIELSGDNGLSLWVPIGFAHGFVALEDDSYVHYKCTNTHVPASERSLNYADPTVGIVWPLQPTLISPKDAIAPPLAQIEANFEFGAK
jgi:dTDP-4-dehydrorhamnose 3,5-epimerase